MRWRSIRGDGVTDVTKTRIVVLISGSGSNLQAIIDACSSDDFPAAVVGVISNRAGVKGLQRAADAGIQNVVLQHTDFTSREDFDLALQEQIDRFDPDLVVLAGFMRILTSGLVEHYAGRMLNIHPSLLPKYTGLHTHRRALEAGDTEHGTTVHFVTVELDGGPPVIQARVPIEPADTEETLAQRVLEQEHKIYPQAILWFAQGRLRLERNHALLDGKVLPPSGFPYL